MAKTGLRQRTAAALSDGKAVATRSRRHLKPRVRAALGFVPVLVIFAVVYGSSALRMLALSFDAPRWSIASYLVLLHDQQLHGVLSYTLGLAAGVTAITLVLSYPVAFVMLHASPRMQRLLILLLVLPLWTSALVRSYAWMVMLGRRGIVNQVLEASGLISEPLSLIYNRVGVYIGMIHILLPYMVFPIYSVMRQIDQRLVLAARSLGAGRTAAMLSVFFPLTLPGVATGCVLVFVVALGFWVTPALLGGLADTTYVMAIETQVNTIVNWPLAAAMSILLLLVTLLILAAAQAVFGFNVADVQAVGQRRAGSRLIRLSITVAKCERRFAAALRACSRQFGIPLDHFGFRRRSLEARARMPVASLITVLVVVFLIGPIIVLIPLSFSAAPFMQFPPQAYSLQWYQRYLSGSDWIDPTIISFKVALATMAIATAMGTLCALSLARAQFRFRKALLAFLLSPMIVPTMVIAVALYFQFATLGLVGTIPGLILAHLILSIPFVILVVMGAMHSFDYSLEQAARSLGAGPLRAFWRVILPLIWPGILTAMFFAFLTSFDEVIVAVFLSGTAAATLPKRLLEATRFEFRPTVASVSVLLMLISAIVVILADLAQRRLLRTPARLTSRTK